MIRNLEIHLLKCKKLGYFYLYFFNVGNSVNIVRRLFKLSMVILDTLTEVIMSQISN